MNDIESRIQQAADILIERARKYSMHGNLLPDRRFIVSFLKYITSHENNHVYIIPLPASLSHFKASDGGNQPIAVKTQVMPMAPYNFSLLDVYWKQNIGHKRKMHCWYIYMIYAQPVADHKRHLVRYAFKVDEYKKYNDNIPEFGDNFFKII